MNKNNIEHCPFCGNKSYYHQTKPMSLRYKSTPITVEQPGFWCDECGEGVIGGGVNAFSRYERGETPISKPLSQLLFILKNHPNLLSEININSIKKISNKPNNDKMAAAG